MGIPAHNAAVVTSEQLVESAVIVVAGHIPLGAILGKERREVVLAVIVDQAAAGDGEVLPAIGDTEAADIDEAGKAGGIGHDIGQAGIAMANHQIFRCWPVFQ